MTAQSSDLLTLAGNGTRPVSTTVGTIRGVGNTSLICADLTGWPITTACHFITYRIDGNKQVVAGSQTDWKGIVNSSTINNLQVTGGADAGNSVGDIVEILPTAAWGNDLVKAIQVHSDPLGNLKQAAVLSALNISSTPPADWTLLPVSPTTIVNNGQRSQTLTFPGVDYTDRLNPGTRLRTTRTVAAPVQSTALNGTNQYWNMVAPNKMTFTNNYVIDLDLKSLVYSTSGGLVSRYNGTNGFVMQQLASGQILIGSYNGGSANSFLVQTYQSYSLSKHNRITAQVDMTVTANTPTTNYIMIDDVDVPCTVVRTGTGPTALVQAGNLEIGSWNGANFSNARFAQVAIFNTKVTQAQMLTYHSQGYLGTETSLVSAYSFNGVATDLMTTTPNNLTAQGSAGYVADSPFGTQASGLIDPKLDYAIVSSATHPASDTIVTVQVPEGCAIPTSGGVSAVSYSGQASPYGFPSLKFLVNMPVQGYVPALETRANGAYGALPTPCSILVNIGQSGVASVNISVGNMYDSVNGGNAYMSFSMSGANTQAATDGYAVKVYATGANVPQIGAGATFVLVGLLPGVTTFTTQFRSSGSDVAGFSDRRISVIPL